MATSAKKYLPVNDQGVAAAHERVLLEVSQQEAALISLLLGATPCMGPGHLVYETLYATLGLVVHDPVRTAASRVLSFSDTTNPNVLAYLGQFPGD